MTNSTIGTSDPKAGAALTHRQIMTILSGLLLGIFLAALDQNIVSVAIVRIANSLDGFDEQAWATTAYLITATITTPLYGKLADIYGRKPFYLLAIGLFVLGSVACTFATSIYQLAAFRAFQGLGAGGLMSLAFTIIGDIVPARERVRYQGYFMMVFGSATVLGPVLGGFLSGYAELAGLEGWRWVFLVNVPVGLLALVVVAKVLDVPHRRQRHRIDWFGALTLTLCAAPLLVVAEQGRQWGWSSNRALLCYAIGAAGLLLFVLVEFLMRDAALIPLRLFRNATFSVAILGGFIVGIAMFGAIVLVPLYFQVVRGYSPTISGLLMLPLVFGIMAGSQTAGLVTKKTGRYKVLPVLGAFVIAIGAALHAQVGYDSPLWQPLVCGAIIGAGLGGCMQTLVIAAQNAGPLADMGVSTAAATFFRQIGGTLGVAAFLTVLFDLLPGRILDAFGGQLPEGFDAARLGAVQSNTGEIAALPAEIRDPILLGFTDSMRAVFLLAAVIAIVAGLVLLSMRELPLKDATASVLESEQPESSWSRARIWEGAAEVVSDPEPVLAGARRNGESRTSSGVSGEEPEAASSGSGPADAASSDAASSDSASSGDASSEAPSSEAASSAGEPSEADASESTALDTEIPDARTARARTSDPLTADSATNDSVANGQPANGKPANRNPAAGIPAAPEPSAPEPFSVTGTISREDGQPVPEVTLTLIDQRGKQAARTDGAPDGGYHLVAPDPGPYVLIAAATGYQPAAVSVTVGWRPQHLDLTLPGTGELSGFVRSAHRAIPLPGATITLTDAHGDVVGAAVSAGDGAYLCHGIVPGTYTLVAVADHMRPGATTLTVPDSGLLRHDVLLAPMAVLAGSARDDDDRAVPDVQITVLDSAGDLTASARTDDTGRYVVPDLPEGQYTVVARGYPPVTSRVTVSGGEVAHDVRVGY